MICPKCKKEIPANSVFCCFCGKKLIIEKTHKKRGNGEGTFFYNEKRKCWVGQKVIGVKPDGSLHRITRTGKTSKEVQAKIRAAIDDYQKSVAKPEVNQTEITVPEIAKQIINKKYAFNIISDATLYRHYETIKIIEKYEIAKIPLQKISAGDIEDFYESITFYSQSTISKICEMCRTAFNAAVKQEYISKNICEDILKPKSKKARKKIRALTVSEQRKLLSVIDNCDYSAQLKIAMFTGMRMGEINALTLDDINFTDRSININKTITRLEHGLPYLSDRPKTFAGNRVLNDVSDDVLKIIQTYIMQNYHDNLRRIIFTDKNSRLITTNQVNSSFKRLWEKYINPDDDVNQHMLRHTFATRCIESGMPPNVLQKILGHEDISTTLNTYVDAFSEYQRKHIDKTQEYLTEQGLNLA